MDPLEDLPHPPAFFPPPAPAAHAPPPIPAAVSLYGPKIFVLSPLPSNKYNVARYFYSPAVDVMMGDYAALLTFAAHYAFPLTIHHCPDLAAFQASYPMAIICPFSEVPPPIIKQGRELQLSYAASAAPPLDGSALSSVLSPSILSHPPVGAPAQGSSRGHDPPSFAAATRASSVPPSFAAATRASSVPLPFPPHRPDPDGFEGPSSVFRMGGFEGMGGLGGSRAMGGNVRIGRNVGNGVSSCLRPHCPSLQFLFILLRRSFSGLQLLRTDTGCNSFCPLSSWRASTSWGTSPRPCICGSSHCSCSFSAAFFAPWEYLHFLGF